MNTNKFLILFSSIFGFVGIVMLVGGFLMYQNTAGFVATAVHTQGTVVDISRVWSSSSSGGSYVYRPIIEFKTKEGADGKFESTNGRNPSPFAKGDVVEILYDPQNPDKAEIDSFGELWVGNLILPGLGIIFFGVALGIWIFMWRSKKIKSWLKSQGQLVQATFVRVEENRSVNMAGRSPWRVVGVWKDSSSGIEYEYKSEDIWTTMPPTVPPAATLPVYIDPQNPKRHVMDMSGW